jgi:lactate permease
MVALIALLPCAAVLITVLVFRLSGVAAAVAAALTALAIWGAGVFTAPTTLLLGHALHDAVILDLLVAAIILPGILFVEASSRRGAPEAIGVVLKSINLNTPKAAIFIVTGVGVTLESLTGMGVSLLVTVPLLINLVDRRNAIGLALIGMSLMPWGALSVSAIVGAELANLQLEQLAAMVWRTSGPVAFVLPMLCLAFVPQSTSRDLGFAAITGLVLAGGIGLASHGIGIEIAGVAGGLAVVLMSLLFANSRDGLKEALAAPALRPYAMLILAVVAQKFLVPPLAAAGIAPAISTDRVTFTVLSSPGVALLIATLATLAIQRRQGSPATLLSTLLKRSWRPLASILLFMISARLLVESGAISALAGLLAGLGSYTAVAAVTGLGALSGYVTGSGIIGNALFMPSAAATGGPFGADAMFAALQNSAAGHAAMAALPVAAILLTALPSRNIADDRTVMSIGLRLSALFTVMLMISGSMLLVTQTHQP